jgi:hypothetical protein
MAQHAEAAPSHHINADTTPKRRVSELWQAGMGVRVSSKHPCEMVDRCTVQHCTHSWPPSRL